GVVHILVSGKPTKYRLPEQPGQCVPTILATACVGQNITRHLGQTEYVVEFAISQQPSIGGHQGAAKLEHQAAVEIQPNSIRSRFTLWVRHGRLASSAGANSTVQCARPSTAASPRLLPISCST